MPSTAEPAVLDALERSEALGTLARWAREGGASSARGAYGSSTALLTGALARRLGCPALLIVAHLDDADEAVDELEGLGITAVRVPAMEIVPGETSISLDLLAERLALLRRLDAGECPEVVVAPIQALMQAVPAPEALGTQLRVLRPGDRVDLHELSAWLDTGGYQRVAALESPGEFSVRGGIVDIFPPGGEPARLDLFGDEVEAIHAVELDSMGSDRRLDQLEIVAASVDQLQVDDRTRSFTDALPDATVAVLAELAELTEQGRSYYERVSDARGILGPPAVFQAVQRRCHAVIDAGQFAAPSMPDRCVDVPVRPLPTFADEAPAAVRELVELAGDHDVRVLVQNEGESQRMREMLAAAYDDSAPPALVEVEVRYLHRGFVWADDEARPRAFVPYHELLHRFQTRRRIRRVAGSRAMDAFVELEPGDHVVHRDHGIARFAGLRTLEDATGTPQEFLVLEFARGAKLNVPASKIELVQKYIGAHAGAPELSSFGGKRWAKQKERVSEAVRDLAAEMLRLQAARASLSGIRYPEDTVWQHEFEAEFPYEETEDQLSALAAVKRDMADAQPMDRLICGDVGFGKTEVAIRAAFKAAEYGKQVAVLVPTTVLAEQHERTFRSRFADYPFRVEAISRFRTGQETKKVLEELRQGRVDIIIGTHRLLSKDVKFADLGLVIIDEEQRFGVEHKQRLLAFRATADVLTLSATPIPRTLHMALLGLRDISSLTTAPLDRRAIVTEVIPFNARRLEQVLARELAREGQVFWVHNRVHDIESVADDVRRLAPDARIIIGHGQMPTRSLEKVMRTFVRGDADILVCTTIIESGIDIPTANTMVIDEAQLFGLSELHQLRGRVGRYKHRAYCYLLLPKDKPASETAVKRLRAIESFSMLGAGFKIALRDLELRGAGNLLGAEQSGHIAAVGYEMYCQLLEQAVADLRNDRKPSAIDTTVDLGVDGALPRGYIPSDARRMDAYRRISQAGDAATLERVRADVESAYGKLPRRAETLFRVAEVRVRAAAIDVASIVVRPPDVILRTRDPRRLEACMRGAKGTLRIVGAPEGDVTTVYYRPPKSYLEPASLMNVLRKRFS